MSTSAAEKYARLVHNAKSIEELRDNTYRALDELIKEIKGLEHDFTQYKSAIRERMELLRQLIRR
jgi:peptidoglycan hydrolase CwlO-like protein